MRGPATIALAAALAGCSTHPPTPEQRRQAQIQDYCTLQATAARDSLSAQQDAGRHPVGGYYGGAAQGAALGNAYEAAYQRCLMEMARQR